MKIFFLNPPFKGRFSRTSRSPAITKGGTLYYPFWLAYAVGVAEQSGHDVRFIDAPADNLELQDIFTLLKDFVPDIAVLDTSTASIYSDVKVGDEIKRRFPHCFVILVGTHPSALPEDTLNLSKSIDAVTIGEYDFTIRDVAHALEQKLSLQNVPGLVFRHNGEYIKTAEREKIEDLDSLPFVTSVYKKYLNYKNYFFAAAKYPMVMIITGRGCPFKCFFCLYPQVFHSRRYRPRSPENIVAEFKYIKENFPDLKEIGIEDDCFTVNTARVRKICQLLIEEKLNMTWYCNVRGDVDYETLSLMKQAGCRLVTVGFESGVQSTLDQMHKNEKIKNYYQFAKDAQKAGVMVHGCIMAGTPGDSLEVQKENYRFALRINCDSMQFYPLYVYPGTEAYTWAKEKGYLKTEDFSQWLTEDGNHNCVIDTDIFTGQELVDLCNQNLRKYHLRPAYILMKLKQAIRDPEEGLRSIKSGIIFIKKILSLKRKGDKC